MKKYLKILCSVLINDSWIIKYGLRKEDDNEYYLIKSAPTKTGFKIGMKEGYLLVDRVADQIVRSKKMKYKYEVHFLYFALKGKIMKNE